MGRIVSSWPSAVVFTSWFVAPKVRTYSLERQRCGAGRQHTKAHSNNKLLRHTFVRWAAVVVLAHTDALCCQLEAFDNNNTCQHKPRLVLNQNTTCSPMLQNAVGQAARRVPI